MPKSNRTEERRRGRRLEVDWELEVRGKSQGGRDFDEAGRLENLSSGGGYFYFQKRLNPGAKIELRIKVPFKNNNWMKYAAQVVRLEQSDEGVGIAVKFNTPRPVFVGA
ncbi:MAG TPA: PilZ domain-containing protein [Blastocatellia bacterium]|nr:PilZ domain-containing protein [Blastocatellia bacterium]